MFFKLYLQSFPGIKWFIKMQEKKQDAKLCDPNVDVRVFYTPLHGHRRKKKKRLERDRPKC